MLLKPLTIATAGLAAATQAFLVPPEVSTHEAELVDIASAGAPLIEKNVVLALDCPGCPPIQTDDDDVVEAGSSGSSHLELTFTIDPQENGDRLMLNGFELYPRSNPFDSVLTAPQVPDQHVKHRKHGKHGKHDEDRESQDHEDHHDRKAHKEHKEHKEHEEHEGHKDHKALKSHHKARPSSKLAAVDQRLGFALRSRPVVIGENEKVQLHAIDFQIIEVGEVFVNGIPDVHIDLIKTQDGELMIANLATGEPHSPNTPMDKQEECTTLLCKWKAIISDHVDKMKHKHCGGGKVKGQHHHHHHHDHPHKGMRVGQHKHSWAQLFRMFSHHILVPVAVGIVAGVSVSIIGMMVGTVLVGLWRKLVRGQSFFPRHHCSRRHRLGRSHKAAPKEVAVEEEKSGLMEHQDPPPSYDEEEAKPSEA